jgi:hypothetical protein
MNNLTLENVEAASDAKGDAAHQPLATALSAVPVIPDDPLMALAIQIKAEVALVGESMHHALQHAKHVGELLLEVKRKIMHGGWLKWVKDNCDVSERMAEHYVKIAKNWTRLEKAHSKSISDLTISKAIKLLQKPKKRKASVAKSAKSEEVPVWAVSDSTSDDIHLHLKGFTQLLQTISVDPESLHLEAVGREEVIHGLEGLKSLIDKAIESLRLEVQASIVCGKEES